MLDAESQRDAARGRLLAAISAAMFLLAVLVVPEEALVMTATDDGELGQGLRSAGDAPDLQEIPGGIGAAQAPDALAGVLELAGLGGQERGHWQADRFGCTLPKHFALTEAARIRYPDRLQCPAPPAARHREPLSGETRKSQRSLKKAL